MQKNKVLVLMKLVYFTVEKLQTVNSKTICYECIFTTPNQQIQMLVLCVSATVL